MIGQFLGRYRIDAKLGEGGMGVVYKAHDMQLGRTVAIKLLPPDTIADADRKSRFIQEAKAASALNHPGIVTVHDFAESDGRAFIVMEYLSGATLDQVIPPHGLPPKLVLKYGAQIADALSKAHESGILHRDLKPSNVLITGEGRAKVLDFGLAKLAEDPSGNATTVAMTDSGIVVGTAAYMSPEQADGRKLDARSDIFSFGSVLYEMTTGRRAFSGDSKLSVLRKIVSEDPAPPSTASGAVSVDLEKTILRCLRKDPARRFQTMADLRVALEDLSIESDAASAPHPARRSTPWWWAAVPIAVIGVITAVALQQQSAVPKDDEPLQALPITALAGTVRDPSLSPEGTHVAFRWNGAKQDNSDIYVQQLGVTSPPLRLTTDPATDFGPKWSPDGRSIAFLRGGFTTGASEVRVIPPLGGAERKIADLNPAAGPLYRPISLSWCPDSSCVVVSDTVADSKLPVIVSIAIDTGEKQQLSFQRTPPVIDLDPTISPDGRWLAFRRDTTPMTGDYFRLPMKGRAAERIEPVRVTVSKSAGDSPSKAAWTPDSRALILSASGGLWRTDAITPGERTRLAFVGQDGIQPSIVATRDGRARLVYVRSIVDGNIWRITTAAAGTPATSPPEVVVRSPRSEFLPNLSPNGGRLLFLSDRSGRQEFWTMDVDGANLLQLTTLEALPGFGRWSPDGSQVVFHSDPQGRPDVLLITANGGPPRVLTAKFDGGAFPSFSRDGRWIYYCNNLDFRIWKIAAAGGEPVPVSKNIGNVAIESVDGQDLYFVDEAVPLAGLWTQPVSGGAARKIIDGVYSSSFDVVAGGIYYLNRTGRADRVMYYDFATRRTTVIADNLGPLTAGITVSQDGRVIIFSRVDSSADELMLVEKFR